MFDYFAEEDKNSGPITPLDDAWLGCFKVHELELNVNKQTGNKQADIQTNKLFCKV